MSGNVIRPPLVGVVAAATALAALTVACASDDATTSSTASSTVPPTVTSPVSTSSTTPPAPAATPGESTATEGTMTNPSTAPKPPVGSATSVYPAGDIDPGLSPYIRVATADLAERLAVDPSTITAVSGVLVVWPNAALGCPQPGMQYAQVAVDGSVIELRANDRVYRYHTGGDRGPFPCDVALDPLPTRLG